MGIYYLFSAVILLVQAIVMVEAWRHVVYTSRKYYPEPGDYQPRAALICPCKGIDTTLDRNINSLFAMDYCDYEVFFVVESSNDPAYDVIKQTIERNNGSKDNSRPAHLLVSGPSDENRSQKVHNLLAVCDSLPRDFEVIAFVDSDIRVKNHFLASLIHPLHQKEVGATTGYRWFVPAENRFSSRVLSAINAFFASVLGPHPWNSAWGGAMALRRTVYDRIGLAKIWSRSFSDDYSLTSAIKGAGLSVSFVPACFAASHESLSWGGLISFVRRQFIITRVYMPHLWLLAMLGIGHFVVAFWLGLIVTIHLYTLGSTNLGYAAVLPMALYIASMLKGCFRQILIRKILPEDRDQLLVPALIDIFLQPLLSLFTLSCLLSTAFTRTIVWRGIRYKLRNAEVKIKVD